MIGLLQSYVRKKWWRLIGVRILGIDPGLATVGFGIVDYVGSRCTPIQYGCITTEAHVFHGERLQDIYVTLGDVITRYTPEVMAIEKLFFNTNVTTAFSVGAARGVIVLAAVQHQLRVAEYTPLQIKQAITSYGRADKKQVQEMVRMYLNLSTVPKPDDVADALAVAICHAHSATMHDLTNEVRQ